MLQCVMNVTAYFFVTEFRTEMLLTVTLRQNMANAVVVANSPRCKPALASAFTCRRFAVIHLPLSQTQADTDSGDCLRWRVKVSRSV